MRYIISLCIVFAFLPALSQDKVLIYFQVGHSKIDTSQYRTLNSIAAKYDLSDLDSVHFIGYADSTGNYKANLRLSEKRARMVAKYCKGLLPKDIPVAVNSIGEKSKQIENSDRRVEMVLYFRPPVIEIAETIDSIKPEEKCYYVDYWLLRRAHFRTITKGKKEFTLIELSHPVDKRSVYYSGTENKAGGVTPKKVKWNAKTTGNLWWKKTRYQAQIPLSDFRKYRIFIIEKAPCNKCGEDFEKKAKITKRDSCLDRDLFLMSNIQLKSSFLNKKTVKIRVPAEYVDITSTYFMDYDTKKPIHWEVQRGKKNKNYYFTKLPIWERGGNQNYYINSITRMMECCTLPDTGWPRLRVNCGFSSHAKQFLWGLEISNNYQQYSHTPYAGIGLYKEWERGQANFVMGIDLNFKPYAVLRYQYNFLSFPFFVINPVAEWGEPGLPVSLGRYGRLYIGSELKTGTNKNEKNFFEQNLHVGLSAVKDNAFLNRIFIQYGIGYDYLKNNSADVYPVLEFGLIMKLKKNN